MSNKKMSKKKKAKKSSKPVATHFLTVCSDCKIRLVVYKEKSKACDLCKSPNVTASAWR